MCIGAQPHWDSCRNYSGNRTAIPSSCPIIVQKREEEDSSDIVRRKTRWRAEGVLAFHQGDEGVQVQGEYRRIVRSKKNNRLLETRMWINLSLMPKTRSKK